MKKILVCVNIPCNKAPSDYEDTRESVAAADLLKRGSSFSA